MVSKRRRDDTSIARRGPTREPRRRILIVCEGSSTERGYFQSFQHAARNPRVHVEVAREHGVPMTVVLDAIRLKEAAEDAARRQRDENLRWDQVWYPKKGAPFGVGSSIEVTRTSDDGGIDGRGLGARLPSSLEGWGTC